MIIYGGGNTDISQNGFENEKLVECFIDLRNYKATPNETPNLGIMPW